MALEISQDPQFPDVAWLHIFDVVTWEDYHGDIDGILQFVEERGQPVDVILLPPPPFPKGNPLPHMRTAYQRMMQASMLRRMIIIEGRSSRLATMLFYVQVRLGMIDGKRFVRVPGIDAAKMLLRSGVATDDTLSR